jgi:glutaredoxin
LYFYTTAENCTECTKQGFVLTELRKKYPDLRVYSFDYNLDLSALRALIKIYKIEDTKLPALIVNEKNITGFSTVEEIEKILPKVKASKILPKTQNN